LVLWFEKNEVPKYNISIFYTYTNIMETPTIEPTTIEKIMDSTIVSYGIKILGAIAVIILLLLISKIIAWWVRRYILRSTDENNKHAEKVAKLMGNITFYVLVIFSFFIGFEMVGFNVGLIVWGISFWVWLAFKEILGNMVAGIMILYTKEFKLWDIIEIKADEVYFGRIEEITIRYTIIKTIDLRSVVIPNMTLISTPIKTFSSEPLIKLSIKFWAHYDSDINKVIEVMKTAVNSFDFVKEKENTKVFLSDYLDSCIEFKAIIGFDPNCGILPYLAEGYIKQKFSEEFEKNNIDIPYEMKTITFETAKDKEKIQENIQQQ